MIVSHLLLHGRTLVSSGELTVPSIAVTVIHRTDRRFKSEHHFPVSGLSSPLQGRGSYFLAVVCDDADLCAGNDLYRATYENDTAFGFCDLHLRNPIHINN